MLVIDDAQYADEGLLDFLDHLVGTATCAVFILALSRPELLARRHDLGGRRTTVVRLDPLDDAAMGRLLDGLVEGLPAPTRAALVGRAEGVPLFAVETIRALIDRDAVIPRDGRYVPADGVTVDLDAIGAPASLQALIAARLDALSPTERRVVTDASVLGAAFTRTGLSRLGSDVADLDTVLDSLVRKEIIALTTDRFSAEIGQYRFVQAMVRQVAYATQSRRDRKQRHLAAADYLGAEPDAADLAVVIAQHLLDAIDASSTTDPDIQGLAQRARSLLEAGAARARSLGSHVEAQRHLEMALSRTPEGNESGPCPPSRGGLRCRRRRRGLRGSIAHAQVATESSTHWACPRKPTGRPVCTHSRWCIWATTRAPSRSPLHAGNDWTILVRSPREALSLADCLASPTWGSASYDEVARYADRSILIAEATDQPLALSRALRQLAAGSSAWAPRSLPWHSTAPPRTSPAASAYRIPSPAP